MRIWFDFVSWLRKNDEIAEKLAMGLDRVRRLDRTVRVLAARIEEDAHERYMPEMVDYYDSRVVDLYGAASIPYRRRRQEGR